MARPISSDIILVNRGGVDYQTSYGEVNPSPCDLPLIPGPPVIALEGAVQVAPAEPGESIVTIRNGDGPGSPTNQWQRGKNQSWNDIAGSTGATHTVVEGDLSYNIRLEQTFSDGSQLYSNEIVVKDGSIPLPWDNWDGGVFHVIMDPGTPYFEVGVFVTPAIGVWTVDGEELATDVNDLAGLGTDEVVFTYGKECAYLFSGCEDFVFGPLTDTSKVTGMEGIFAYAAPNPDIDFHLLDMSNVTTIKRIFLGVWTLDVLNVSDWDLRNCKNISEFGIEAPEMHLENWQLGTDVDMYRAFYEIQDPDADFTNWDTSGVTDMEALFGDETIYEGDLSMWCVSQFASEPDGFRPAGWAEDDARLPKWGQAC